MDSLHHSNPLTGPLATRPRWFRIPIVPLHTYPKIMLMSNADKDAEQLDLSEIVGGNVNAAATLENSLPIFCRFKLH